MSQSQVFAALSVQVKPEHDAACLADAINACLVFAGVRTAARLDNQPSKAFLRKLQMLGQSRGVQVVEWGNGTEPLLVDPEGLGALKGAVHPACSPACPGYGEKHGRH